MTEIEGLLSTDLISTMDRFDNSRLVTILQRAKIKEGAYNVVRSIFSGSIQLPLSFKAQFL